MSRLCQPLDNEIAGIAKRLKWLTCMQFPQNLICLLPCRKFLSCLLQRNRPAKAPSCLLPGATSVCV